MTAVFAIYTNRTKTSVRESKHSVITLLARHCFQNKLCSSQTSFCITEKRIQHGLTRNSLSYRGGLVEAAKQLWSVCLRSGSQRNGTTKRKERNFSNNTRSSENAKRASRLPMRLL